MKSYERKLKIEIITILVMIDYILMIRRASSEIEESVLAGIALLWTIFALGYHIWDLKKRGLTLTDGIKSFTDRIKGLKYFSRIYTKMFKYGTSIIIILGMVLVALNVINTEVLNTSFIKYIINIGMSLAFSLGMTEAIVFCMAGIDFELILSKRKTMSIEISAEGEVKVRAPMGISEEVIISQVMEKGKWILEKREEAYKRNSKKVEKNYKDGDLFMYLGNKYSLKIKFSPFLKRISVRIIGKELVVCMTEYNKERLRKAIELWYREEGVRIIKDRVNHYLKFYPVKPRSIKVKEQKRRWGSCTYYNDLLFNWRCIMAPLKVVDYIVVHEMTHIVHKDHSKNYWNFVSKIIPNYKEQKMWLKENGIIMDI